MVRKTITVGALLLAGTMLTASGVQAEPYPGYYASPWYQYNAQLKERRYAESQYYKQRAYAQAYRYKYGGYGYRPYYSY